VCVSPSESVKVTDILVIKPIRCAFAHPDRKGEERIPVKPEITTGKICSDEIIYNLRHPSRGKCVCGHPGA